MSLEEIPSVRELFDLLEDDPSWKKIGESYLFVIDIMVKIIEKIFDKIKNIKNDELENYIEFYLGEYIIRTIRFTSAFILLSIYNMFREAFVLYRPLLENIAETKYFLQSPRRRAIRKIKLHRLLNEKRRYEFYQEKYKNQINKDGYIILPKYNVDEDKKLKEKIENGLSNFNDNEIKKMEENINSNRSWHGKHIKQLLMDLNMNDLIEDYQTSCKVIHVRDFAWNFEENDFLIKLLLINYMLLLLEHIKDYKTIFNEIIDEQVKKDTQMQIEKLNKELLELIMKDEDFNEFYIVKYDE